MEERNSSDYLERLSQLAKVIVTWTTAWQLVDSTPVCFCKNYTLSDYESRSTDDESLSQTRYCTEARSQTVHHRQNPKKVTPESARLLEFQSTPPNHGAIGRIPAEFRDGENYLRRSRNVNFSEMVHKKIKRFAAFLRGASHAAHRPIHRRLLFLSPSEKEKDVKMK